MTGVSLVDEGREDPSTTISGSSSARQRNAIKWRADDGPTLNAGLVAAIFQGIQTCIARKPYIFVCFQGGPDPLSPLWIRTCQWIKARNSIQLKLVKMKAQFIFYLALRRISSPPMQSAPLISELVSTI